MKKSEIRYLLAPWEREVPDPKTRARRSIGTGVLVSVLVHAILLFITIRLRSETQAPPGLAIHAPIAVRLRQRAAPALASAPAPAPSSPLPKAPSAKTPPPERSPRIALNRPSKPSPPVATTPPAPRVPAPPSGASGAPDMMAMINANRQRRQAAESQTAQENAQARAGNSDAPSNDIAMANIKRNLERGRGRTGGVFEILNIGTRTAQYSFRGWSSDSPTTTHQIIEVDAGLGGNVELAIVRSMIALIRTHYSGAFDWDSHRLGRVVQLSAAPEHNAELEAFMMREFFDVGGPGRPR
jgi:hypothetical protein